MTDVDAYDLLDDTLAFWHPVRDEEIDESYLPWGPVAPASSADTTLRVKNLSADYTAAAITLSCADPPGSAYTRSVAAQHLLSADGITFTAALSIGDLDPQALSGLVWLRRVTDPGADPGDGSFQLTAVPGSWAVPDPNPGGGDPDDDGGAAPGDEDEDLL